LPLYSRYLLQKTTAAFAAIISVLVLLVWFSKAISFIGYVTENGVSLDKFFYLFVLILPWLLLFIAPISLLTAILLIFNRMNITNEIIILKNSGLTKLQICKPIILLAILISLFCYGISFYLMPYANKEMRILRVNINNNYTSLSFNPQTFETLKGLTIYAKDRDENNQLSGLLLHDERNAQYSLTITAKTGKIALEDRSALLHMEDGTVQKLNYSDGRSEILNFDSYIFNLTEMQKSYGSFRWKESELYMHELLNPGIDVDGERLAKYRVEINQRLTYPLLPIAFTFIAAALVLHGQFNRHGNSQNTIAAILTAAIFLSLMIGSYSLIEISPKFVALPYLNFLLFMAVGLRLLVGNYRNNHSL